MKLHKYQQDAVDFAVYKGATYMMLDMGMGKTAIAIKAIERVGMPAVVFAPLMPALTTWPTEISKWSQLGYKVLHGKNKGVGLHFNRGITIIPYSSLAWFYKQCVAGKFPLRKYFMVFDESSMLKAYNTKRYKMMLGLRRMFSDYRMHLSGTPATNGLHNLWAQYFLLDGGKRLETNYTTFRKLYFNYWPPPQFRTEIKPEMKPILFNQIKDITYRLKASDYLDMPPIVYNHIPLVLPHSVMQLYHKTGNEMMWKEQVLTKASLSNKLRQIVQGAVYDPVPKGQVANKFKLLHSVKSNALRDLVDVANGKSVLCAINYRFEYDMLCTVFKKKLPLVAGGVSKKTSLSLIKKWNEGRLPLLLAHPASIGHGVNLQSGGNTIVWYGPTFNLDHYLQFNARLWRQGQSKGVVVHHLMAERTIDNRVFKALCAKDATQQSLLNAVYRSDVGP
jgi:SNF2 family DNA or RNA helicase